MISILNNSSSFRQLIDIVKKIKNSNVAVEDDSFDVHNKQLCSIQLVGNRIKTIDDLFSYLCVTSSGTLREANISFNSLQSMPSMSPFRQLTILDISHNRVESLSFITDIELLRVFRCHCNNVYSLQHFHKSRLQYTLEELWISDNHIEWQQFAYLLEYNSLQVLMCDENPSDSKPKLFDFLSKVLPSLSFLNGEHIHDHDNDNISKTQLQLKEDESTTLSTDFKVIMTQLKAFIRHQESAALSAVTMSDSPDQHKTLLKQISKSRQRMNSTGSSENEEAINSLTKRSLSRSSSKQSIISDDDLAIVETSHAKLATSRSKQSKTRSAPPRPRRVAADMSEVDETGTEQDSTVIAKDKVVDIDKDDSVLTSQSNDQAAGSAVKLLKQRKASRKVTVKAHSKIGEASSTMDLASLNANLDQMLSDMKMMKGAQPLPPSSNFPAKIGKS